MITITEIVQDSIADSLSLQAGDRVVSVDGELVRDFLDVLLAERLTDVALVVEKVDGDLWQFDIEKEVDEPFGFVLEHPEPKRCGNSCIFCFVHQLPKGMRQTLYVKDEDYRFSYLYGAYITLSNLDDTDIERIIEQKLSPLYVSVHAVDPVLRAQMLGREVPAVLPVLHRLVDAGIEIHTQIVVCPGVNDENALTTSVEQLSSLYPGVRSLALVPVGLTEHRTRLDSLRLASKEEAREILNKLSGWQTVFLKQNDSRFVFAADEFYLKAEQPFPDIAAYEELYQLENGVGMIPLFRSEIEDVLKEAESMPCPVAFSVVTGVAFSAELKQFLTLLAEKNGCKPYLYPIENLFFGPSVTVAGLVTGHDIATKLDGLNLGSALLIPDVMMRDGERVFLDDMTPVSLEQRLGCKVVVIPSDPLGILEAIEAFVDE